MSDSVPPVRKPELIERVFDKKLLFFAACLAVFVDIVHARVFGTNITHFSKTDFDAAVNYGWALMASVAYLFLMCSMPTIRYCAARALFSPLYELYVKKIKIPIDPGWVPIQRLKDYAISKSLRIDWDIAVAREQEIKAAEEMNVLRFTTAVLLAVEVWVPGSLASETIRTYAPEWARAVQIVATLPLISMLGTSLAPGQHLEDYLYLPEHALAKAERERRDKEAADQARILGTGHRVSDMFADTRR